MRRLRETGSKTANERDELAPPHVHPKQKTTLKSI
jgi:hypothetical protein